MIGNKHKTFEYLATHTQLILQAVRILKLRDDAYEILISNLENDADKILHELASYQFHSFILPYDKEDIQDIAEAIDDVMDYIERIANRTSIYDMSGDAIQYDSMLDLIEEGVQAIHSFFVNAKGGFKSEEVIAITTILSGVEVKGDHVFRDKLQVLWNHQGVITNEELIRAIQTKDILDFAENALDSLDKVGVLLDRIRIKYL